MNSKYVSNIYVGSDGKLHKVIGGADTVLNFSSAKTLNKKLIGSGNSNSANSFNASIIPNYNKLSNYNSTYDYHKINSSN